MKKSLNRFMAAILSVMMIVTSLPADVFATGLTGPAADVSACEDVITYEDVSSCDDVSTDDVYVEESVSDNEDTQEDVIEEVPGEPKDYDGSSMVKVKMSWEYQDGLSIDRGADLIYGIVDLGSFDGPEYYTQSKEIIIHKKYTSLPVEKCVIVASAMIVDDYKSFKLIEIEPDDLADYTHKFSIPQSLVLEAEKAGKDINVRILHAKKSASMKYDVPGDVTVYTYEPVTKENEIKVKGGKNGNATVNPNNQAKLDIPYYFTFEYDEEVYSDESVSLAGATLTALTDEYYESEKDKEDGKLTCVKYYSYTATEPSDVVVKATFTAKAVSGKTFTVTNESGHLYFEKDNQYFTCEGSEYTFKDNVTDFSFVIVSSSLYEPDVKLTKKDHTEIYLKPASSEFTDNHRNKKYTYSNLAAGSFADGSITIGERKLPAPKLYILGGESNAFKTSAITADRKELTITKDGSQFYYDDEFGSTVCISTEDLPGYTVTGFLCGTDEKNLSTIKPEKNGKVNITLWENTYLKVETEGEETIFTDLHCEEGYVAVKDKATLNASYYDTSAVIGVSKGGIEEIYEVISTYGDTELKDFATINPDGTVTVDFTKADDIFEPITVTFAGSFGTKFLTFDVAQKIKSIAIDGAGEGGKDMWHPAVFDVTQGGSKTVSIILNEKADKDALTMYFDNDKAKVYYSLDRDKCELTVNTFMSNTYFDQLIEIGQLSFSMGDNTGATAFFGVKCTGFEIPEPKFKVVSISDRYFDILVEEDESMKDIVNIKYRVQAVATGEYSDPMREGSDSFVTYPGYILRLYVGDDDNSKVHKATEYKITVQGVQARFNPDDPGEYTKNVSVVAETTVSTKDTAYETNLSFDRKSITVFYGDRDVVLANLKYSKKTSVLECDRGELVDSKGNIVKKIGGKGSDLWFDSTPDRICMDVNVDPGKYTLYVYPVTEYKSDKAAKLSITVKAPASDLKLTAPSKVICKKNKKVFNFTVKAKVTSTINKKNYKPANSKVKWTVDSENPALKKALKVKNGKVTIAKNFYPYLGDDNSFTVTASVKTFGDNQVTESMTFEVVSATYEPEKMLIGYEVVGLDKESVKDTNYNSPKYNNQPFTVFDKYGDEIPFGNMSVSVSPSKGFTVTDGRVHVTKPGTYKVTVKMNDGGKKSLTGYFKVSAAELDEANPFIDTISVETCDEKTSLDTLWDSNNVAKISFCDSIIVESKAKYTPAYHSNELYAETTTVKAKNAKLISQADEYVFIPTKSNVEITISHKIAGKTKSKKYKIHIESMGTGTVTAPKDGIAIYTDYKRTETVPVTFDLKGVKYDPERNYSFVPYACKESYNINSVEDEIRFAIAGRYLYSEEIEAKTDATETKLLSLTSKLDMVKAVYDIKDSGYDLSGSTTLTLTLYSVSKTGNDIRQESKPVKVTVTVKSGTPFPKLSYNTNYSMKRDAEEVVITCKKCNDLAYAYIMESYCLYNVSGVKAEKEIKNYFTVKSGKKKSDGSFDIRLIRNDTPVPKGVTTISGWISYNCIGYDDRSYEFWQKITIKIK